MSNEATQQDQAEKASTAEKAGNGPAQQSSPMPAPAAPPPPTGIMSRVDALLKLTAGAALTYRNMINLKLFAATVTSVSKSQIVINSPNGGGSITFPLTTMDGALMLPIGILA